jgi:hypothetical protein
MADEKFTENLMRALVAELHMLNLQNASREMFGRGYFSLGIGVMATFRKLTSPNAIGRAVASPMRARTRITAAASSKRPYPNWAGSTSWSTTRPTRPPSSLSLFDICPAFPP